MITNVSYQIYKTGFPLGTARPLPRFITNSKSIVSFDKNRDTHVRYGDKLCFFRCFAFHQTKSKYCERLTRQLHQKWCQYVVEHKMKSTDITLNVMPDIEMCFHVNVNVFELHEDKTVQILYKSREIYRKRV